MSTIVPLHGFGSLVAGAEALAEDATFRVWRGKIYERTKRYIRYQAFS